MFFFDGYLTKSFRRERFSLNGFFKNYKKNSITTFNEIRTSSIYTNVPINLLILKKKLKIQTNHVVFVEIQKSQYGCNSFLKMYFR